MRHGLVLVVASLGTACGGAEAPTPMNPFNKRVPRILQTHLGKTLDAWLQETSHPEAATRAQAAWAIGLLHGANEARADALRTLLQDDDANVRFAAVVAAGRVPLTDAASARLVIEQLGGTRAMRRQARASAAYMGPAALDPLDDAMHSKDPFVRWSAAWIARRLGAVAEPLVRTLWKMLVGDEASNQRQAALAMGAIGRKGPERLAELLSGTQASTRELAELGLRNTTARGVPVLVALLEGADTEHADFAAGVFAGRPALARLAIPQLVAALNDEGPKGADAAEALIQVGVEAVQALRAAQAGASPQLYATIDDVIARIEHAKNAKR